MKKRIFHYQWIWFRAAISLLPVLIAVFSANMNVIVLAFMSVPIIIAVILIILTVKAEKTLTSPFVEKKVKVTDEQGKVKIKLRHMFED